MGFATLANVDLRRGEVERGAAYAVDLVQQVRGQESQRLRDRLKSVRANLAAVASTTTRDAAEMIDGALRVPL